MLGGGGVRQRDTFAASDAPEMPPMSMHCAPRACPCVSPFRFCWKSPPRDPKKNAVVGRWVRVRSWLPQHRNVCCLLTFLSGVPVVLWTGRESFGGQSRFSRCPRGGALGTRRHFKHKQTEGN